MLLTKKERLSFCVDAPHLVKIGRNISRIYRKRREFIISRDFSISYGYIINSFSIAYDYIISINKTHRYLSVPTSR